MSRRGATLELAVLGLLHQAPMHGYELRKRLNAVLGAFRALSYGTLYPCLRSLVEQGWIAESGHHDRPPAGRSSSVGGAADRGSSKRARIVYELTAEGKDEFQELISQAGPAAWEDGSFDVHFAFFSHTESAVRLRILEGRRSRLEERVDAFRGTVARARERADAYTSELQRHGLESTEREVRWLNELIETERGSTLGRLADEPPRSSASTRQAGDASGRRDSATQDASSALPQPDRPPAHRAHVHPAQVHPAQDHPAQGRPTTRRPTKE